MVSINRDPSTAYLVLAGVELVDSKDITDEGVDTVILIHNMVAIGSTEEQVPSGLLSKVVWVVDNVANIVGHRW